MSESKIGSNQKQFKLDQRVRFHFGDFGSPDPLQGVGTILGQASSGLVDFYIVLLDKPLSTHRAITVPSPQLEPLNRETCPKCGKPEAVQEDADQSDREADAGRRDATPWELAMCWGKRGGNCG